MVDLPPLPAVPGPEEQRFRALVTRHLEGDLSAAELAELDALLHGNEARTELFFSTQVLAHSLAECGEAWLQESPVKPASDEQQLPPGKHSLLSVGYWREHRMQFGALALALTLMLWVGVGYLVILRVQGNRDLATGETSIATITGMHNATWAEGATAYPEQASLAAGDMLALSEGFVEVTFQHGAVVLIEAPVEFTVNTRSAGTLEQGRLFARIVEQADRPRDPAAVAFSVSTPLALILDMGTEFGVEAQENGPTEVHVYQGLVEATPQGAARTPQSKPLRLTEGQAARIVAGEGAIATKDSDEFIREMPEGNAKTVLLAVDNYRTVDMIRTTAGARMMTVYAFHHPHESNVLLSFDLSPYYGQQVAGPGRLTLTTTADSVGQRAESASSHQLELRQLNTFNAGLDFDAASSFFLDGVENEGSTAWRSNSGEEIEQLNYEGAALDVTSGLIATKAGPFGGDTPTTLIAPGTHIVLTIPRETLQRWLDQTEPPIVLLGATGELDLIKFGTGEDQPAPSLRFDVIDLAAANADSTLPENP